MLFDLLGGEPHSNSIGSQFELKEYFRHERNVGQCEFAQYHECSTVNLENGPWKAKDVAT